MLVMIGASASGKTEIAKILIKDHGFSKMITNTTRPPRPDEIDGVDYHFLDTLTFLNHKEAGVFIETVVYNDHWYGTAFQDTAPNKVLIVDPQGANVIHRKLGDQAVFFYIESPENLRRFRMIKRGDDPEIVEQRIEKDAYRFHQYALDHIDHIIENHHESLSSLATRILSLYRQHYPKI